mmetsp:Transcript_14157/g.23560  ORF Transcript_14157/g.23560 Transcript_14157/m.23560 type:complete len:382 (+) Transcript_14157:199-1344(+)
MGLAPSKPPRQPLIIYQPPSPAPRPLASRPPVPHPRTLQKTRKFLGNSTAKSEIQSARRRRVASKRVVQTGMLLRSGNAWDAVSLNAPALPPPSPRFFIVERKASLVPEGSIEVFRQGHEREPSVLVKPRADSPNCTHDLFRIPKTGSTALYNAVQLDPFLHEHVCWNRFHHNRTHHALPNSPRHFPIVVAMKHPLKMIESGFAYSNFKTNDTTDVHVNASLRNRKGPQYYNLHIYSFTRRHEEDVILCVDDKHPDMAEQLRRAFRDDRIASIPFENVNHRTRRIISIGKPLSEFVHPFDVAAWEMACGAANELRRSQSFATTKPNLTRVGSMNSVRSIRSAVRKPLNSAPATPKINDRLNSSDHAMQGKTGTYPLSKFHE